MDTVVLTGLLCSFPAVNFLTWLVLALFSPFLALGVSLRLPGMVVSPESVLNGPFLCGGGVGDVGSKAACGISGTGVLWFCAGGGVGRPKEVMLGGSVRFDRPLCHSQAAPAAAGAPQHPRV